MQFFPSFSFFANTCSQTPKSGGAWDISILENPLLSVEGNFIGLTPTDTLLLLWVDAGSVACRALVDLVLEMSFID